MPGNDRLCYHDNINSDFNLSATPDGRGRSIGGNKIKQGFVSGSNGHHGFIPAIVHVSYDLLKKIIGAQFG